MTVAGMRGHVMALIVLVGRINAVAAKVTFVDGVANPARKDAGLGWDPIADGGVRPELVLFLRGFFRLGRAARSLALTIQEAAGDLLRRVPQRLKELVAAVVADISEAGHLSDVAGARNATIKGEDETLGEQWASDGEPEADVGLDMEAMPDEVKVVPYEPPTMEWDEFAPLRLYAAQLSEPAPVDTVGAGGVYRAPNCILPPLPMCQSTASSKVSVLSFVRAVTVDPVTIWLPHKKWKEINALIKMLDDKLFSTVTLAAELNRPKPVEQRLLRGSVACLGPAIAFLGHLRVLLASLLRCLQATMVDYEAFVGDTFASNKVYEKTSSVHGDGDGGHGGTCSRSSSATSTSSSSGASDEESGADREEEDNTSREGMANAHPSRIFTAAQYAKTWLRRVATACGFKAIYTDEGDQDDNILKTGIWAPGLPILRALPDFLGAAVADTDLVDCNNDMGKEKVYTGGSFCAFCTCKHPKCIGVKILDGSAGQRMPLGLIIQRFATLPAVIMYEISCATLKTALVRLPYMAKVVQMNLDRYQWHKSHTDC